MTKIKKTMIAMSGDEFVVKVFWYFCDIDSEQVILNTC
jgi:hypothetical protein